MSKKQKTISYNGTTYIGAMKNGKLTVRAHRTARGQGFIAGSYDFTAGTWDMQNPKVPFPNEVRNEMIKAFRA